MCERYYLIAVLISISLIARGIEHLFIGLLALCVSSDVFFGKMSTQILCPFCNWVVFYYWVVKIFGTFWMLDPPWSDNVICECFLQFGGLSFCSLDDLECRLSVFLLFCFFWSFVLLVSYLRNHCLTQSHKCFLPTVFLVWLLVFSLWSILS